MYAVNDSLLLHKQCLIEVLPVAALRSPVTAVMNPQYLYLLQCDTAWSDVSF